MNDNTVALVETYTDKTEQTIIKCATFTDISLNEFMLCRVKLILASLVIVILGIFVHRWWSLAISVIAMARLFGHFTAYAHDYADIKAVILDMKIEKSVHDFLEKNGSVTLKVVEHIDEGTAERGDTEG